MKIVADENIPLSSVEHLRGLGHDVLSVSTESPGISDLQVLELANQTSRLLITFDKDFGDIVFRQRRYPRVGIVWFRLGTRAPLMLAQVIASVLESRADWSGFFSVVDDAHIRMIPLPE